MTLGRIARSYDCEQNVILNILSVVIQESGQGGAAYQALEAKRHRLSDAEPPALAWVIKNTRNTRRRQIWIIIGS